jgi:hypothetical protein
MSLLNSVNTALSSVDLDPVKFESKKLLTKIVSAIAITILSVLAIEMVPYLLIGLPLPAISVVIAPLMNLAFFGKIALIATLQYLFERATTFLVGKPSDDDTAGERYVKVYLPFLVSIIGSYFTVNFIQNASLKVPFIQKIMPFGETFDDDDYDCDCENTEIDLELPECEYVGFVESIGLKFGTETFSLVLNPVGFVVKKVATLGYKGICGASQYAYKKLTA